jgi:hypothetical protein
MISSALGFRARVEQNLNGRRPEVICLNRPTAGLELDSDIPQAVPPKLIVTSPLSGHPRPLSQVAGRRP